MTDIEKLPLLVATFYGRARDWYESLQPNQQVNYQLMVQQFKAAKYIRRRNATEVREELFRLRMSSTKYIEYERDFINIWTMSIRLCSRTVD